jgi:hypothetical protein
MVGSLLSEMVLNVPAGAKIYLGKPSCPMDAGLTRSIGQLLGECPAVGEGHIPQCWVPALGTDPGQVLVVVLSHNHHEQLKDVSEELSSKLARILPPNSHLDLWLMAADDPLIAAVRRAGCQISGERSCEGSS